MFGLLPQNLSLLEESESSLEDLGVLDRSDVLLEQRNRDLSWPEDMRALGGAGKAGEGRPGERGWGNSRD